MFNRLSPIWGVVLGFWIPIAFLRNIDGYAQIQRWHETLFTYATAWSANALWITLFCLAWLILWAIPLLIARGPAGRAFDFATVLLGRMGLMLALAAMMAAWFGVRGAGIAKLLPGAAVTVPTAALIALIATWRRREPGPLLVLSRRVALFSSFALFLMPVAAFLEWRDARPGPDPQVAQRGAHPDMVLITIDTLAANRMSLYGLERQTTPRIDELARTSIVFDRAYANSNYTTPTMASLMLGVRPWTHRALGLFSRPMDQMLDANLLRALDGAGYRVLTVDTNVHASPTQQRLRRWVDEDAWGRVESFTYNSLQLARWLPQFGTGSGIGFTSLVIKSTEKILVRRGVLSQSSHFDPELAFSEARRLWSQPGDAPRFLWVHLYGPHEPYASTPEFLGRYDASPHRRTRFNSIPPYLFSARTRKDFPHDWTGRYDEATLMTDHHVGAFVDWLKSRGEFDRTVLAITADHGESFGHEYGGHGGPMMWDDLIRIPLLIKPADHATGLRNATLAEQVDLAPTLLGLAGLPSPAGFEGVALPLDGRDAAGDVWSMNLEQSPRYGELHTGTLVLIEGPWKYIRHRGPQRYPNMPALSDGLYDLTRDPQELQNVIGAHPEVAARMKAAIEERLKTDGRPVN